MRSILRRLRSLGRAGGGPEVCSRLFEIHSGLRFCFFGLGFCRCRLGFGFLGFDPGFGSCFGSLCRHFFGVELSLSRVLLGFDSGLGGIGAFFGELLGLFGVFFDGIPLIVDLVDGGVFPGFDVRFPLVTAREEEERECSR